jgi:deoxyribodipyrimidine photo-lyase
MVAPVLVWYRQDLRMTDQPALFQAAATGRPVIPVYIHAPEEDATWSPGAASRWWLHRALESLDGELRESQSRLIIRRGPTDRTLEALLRETGADTVYWTRRYEPTAIRRDSALKTALRAQGVTVESFNGQLLREPQEIANKAGGPFKVFTPFWRHYQSLGEPTCPLPRPSRLSAPSTWPEGLSVDELKLNPRIAWDAGFHAEWSATPQGAAAELLQFLPERMARYNQDRDFPAEKGTSRLSPFLHFGQISPREIWRTASEQVVGRKGSGDAENASPFLRQLVWREFAHHLLYHFPHTPEEPLKPEFARFPWVNDADRLSAWQRGQTGYPIVDAGMRQLWATGWMHNRVRMIVGSFLVKDLLLSWTHGAAWFWDTLVDADLANNTLGWQWIGGCGADAAPYFRIFNPVLQSEKFDPDGTYIRRWVPELAGLRGKALHAPWEADRASLKAAGVILGGNYPEPIVDHKEARDLALEALKSISRDKHSSM